MNMDIESLTPHEIGTMSDEDFTMLILVLGPIPDPASNTVYMPQEDWMRIDKETGWGSSYEGTLQAFGERILRMKGIRRDWK